MLPRCRENNDPAAIKHFSWIPNDILHMLSLGTEVRYVYHFNSSCNSADIYGYQGYDRDGFRTLYSSSPFICDNTAVYIQKYIGN